MEFLGREGGERKIRDCSVNFQPWALSQMRSAIPNFAFLERFFFFFFPIFPREGRISQQNRSTPSVGTSCLFSLCSNGEIQCGSIASARKSGILFEGKPGQQREQRLTPGAEGWLCCFRKIQKDLGCAASFPNLPVCLWDSQPSVLLL